MKREIRVFLTALMFFTRIPVPKNIGVTDLNKSSRYFPLVGIIVGLTGALTYYGAFFLFKDPWIASFLSLGATLLVTGAFHEDGLADVADGFGGGWTKERILEIMKDSRVGAYGVIALIVVLGLKVTLVTKLTDTLLTKLSDPLATKRTDILITNLADTLILYVAAHSVSRTMPVFFLRFMHYSREDDLSKIKPLATQISWWGLFTAIITGLLPLFIAVLAFHFNAYLFLSVIPCGLLTLYLGWYFKKWIGGYTGDCLGATQQLNELVFYLSVLALWRFLL
ncbi:adenosylcobinamide-GDP ribazoletransferase [Chitinophaga oryziterrae]|uniref:Adenosylcobinamide-GDP ribazoletransferase n=1 Tax=Chitinophaga oryziterrae TaxID=1031224 RepID=A0A6N8JDE7_9BACT|nr:adenosylcobinamide-GDP ribazoletransferase [Chitinophaga oryziterrae]